MKYLNLSITIECIAFKSSVPKSCGAGQFADKLPM